MDGCANVIILRSMTLECVPVLHFFVVPTQWVEIEGDPVFSWATGRVSHPKCVNCVALSIDWLNDCAREGSPNDDGWMCKTACLTVHEWRDEEFGYTKIGCPTVEDEEVKKSQHCEYLRVHNILAINATANLLVMQCSAVVKKVENKSPVLGADNWFEWRRRWWSPAEV